MDILSKTFGIYWAKGIDNFMGCIRPKVWTIFAKLWDILVHWIYLAKTKGCLRQNYGIYWKKLWDILWDIFVKGYGIYLTKNEGHIG